MSLVHNYQDLLPDYLPVMREKGQPTVWLPKKNAIQHERFSANPDLDEERLSIRSRSWIMNFHMRRGKSIKYLYWKFLI